MAIINVNVDRKVFNEAYLPLLDDDTRTQIIFGGSSSGKSVFVADRIVWDMLKGGRNYLVIRNVGLSLRTSAFNEIKKSINRWNLGKSFTIRDLCITCKNGYQILFKGLDDVQKVKSITPEKGVITDIWVEEATETKYDDIKELIKRLRGLSKHRKRITLTFNPIVRTHWIYQTYFKGRFQDDDRLYRDDELVILRTTYKDNKFLEREDVLALENEKDEYYYKVYTLGKWGTLGNVIFKNWHTEDLTDVRDQLGTYRNGLDFGFSNDPTAYVRDAIRGKKLYITDSLYEYGLTNRQIAEALLPRVWKGEEVKCDSAEPKSIMELRLLGLNAVSAMKGPGSVNFGIQYLQQFEEIIIHRELQDVINEFTMYQWQKNRDGRVMNIPVDRDNHAIDAIRYSVSDVFGEQTDNNQQDPRAYGIPM